MGRGGCNAFDNFMAQQAAYHHEQEEERRAKAKAKRDAERRYEVALRGRGGFPATVTLYESSTLAELADEARRALFPDVAGGEVFFVDAAAGRPIYRDGAVLVASLAREPLTFDARVVAAPRWRVEVRLALRLLGALAAARRAAAVDEATYAHLGDARAIDATRAPPGVSDAVFQLLPLAAREACVRASRRALPRLHEPPPEPAAAAPADPDAILLCYEDHDAAAAYDGDGPVYRPCRAAGKGDRLHCYVSIGGESVLFPYARLVHDAAGVRNVRVSSVLTNVRKRLARLAREAVLGTTRVADAAREAARVAEDFAPRHRALAAKSEAELAAEARGADVARQCAAPVADDAAADARAAALLPRAAAGCLGAARELAALRRDQLGLREAQAAQADRFLAHHEKARFAGAVRFAATLERDADGPVVDRIVGFL